MKKREDVMAKWVELVNGIKFYKVEVNELDKDRSLEFALEVVKETYDRYHQGKTEKGINDRVGNIYRGKLGEQAFALMMKNEFYTTVELDYTVLPGINNVDEFDVFLNGKKIDIKMSCDNQNRGIVRCYDLNFPVPKTQTIKDVTVMSFCDKDVNNIYIMSWVEKEYYENNYVDGFFYDKQGNKVPFYKLPLKKGNEMRDFVDWMGGFPFE